jgi:hypothetical protein
MPIWKDRPEFEMQVVGRFLWKLVVTVAVTLLVMGLVGLIVDAVFDLPTTEVID